MENVGKSSMFVACVGLEEANVLAMFMSVCTGVSSYALSWDVIYSWMVINAWNMDEKY